MLIWKIHEAFNANPPKLAKNVEKREEEKKGVLIQKPEIAPILKELNQYSE